MSMIFVEVSHVPKAVAFDFSILILATDAAA
jgi:hypothetical protein